MHDVSGGYMTAMAGRGEEPTSPSVSPLTTLTNGLDVALVRHHHGRADGVHDAGPHLGLLSHHTQREDDGRFSARVEASWGETAYLTPIQCA